MTTEKKTPLNLRQKMAAVAGEIGDLKPDGWNDFHRYKYFSDEQLSGIFRQKFAAHGIVLVPFVEAIEMTPFETDKGKRSLLTTLTVRWTIYDTDSDEKIEARTVGQGDDPGDKGANKAQTASFKYLLIKTFQVGGEGSDAEADTSTDERHDEKKPARKARVEKPATKLEGVQKGGRQAEASDPQVSRVSVLAKEIGIGLDGLANVVKNVLKVDIEMPESDDDKKKMMRAFMENLTAEEIGQIVQALEAAKARA